MHVFVQNLGLSGFRLRLFCVADFFVMNPTWEPSWQGYRSRPEQSTRLNRITNARRHSASTVGHADVPV